MGTMDEIEVIRTSDFTLAATLLATGFDIMGLDKTNPKHVVFIYKRTSDLEVQVKKFWANEIKINPKDFVYSQREIRAMIHTE